MQDNKEREFRDSGSNANTKIRFDVRAMLYVPAFTQKDFQTGPPIKGTSTEEFAITKLGVHNSSLQHNHLYTRGRAQSQNNNHLYTRGIKA